MRAAGRIGWIDESRGLVAQHLHNWLERARKRSELRAIAFGLSLRRLRSAGKAEDELLRPNKWGSQLLTKRAFPTIA